MAVVVTPNAYVNGATLDPDLHNQNIASTTGDEGIVTESNGGLDAANLDAAFDIHQEHVQAEHACAMKKETATEPLDFMDDAFCSAVDSQYWTAIAGVGIKFNVPFACTLAMLQWTAFFSPYRVKWDELDAQGVHLRYYQSDIIVKTFIDGTQIYATQRSFPITAYYSGPAVNGIINTSEEFAGVTIDMSRILSPLTKGDHDMSVKLYMEACVTDPAFGAPTQFQSNIGRVINGVAAVFTTHVLHNRLTLGIRNVRMIRFL